MSINERAKELRLPNPATPEDLECRWSKTLTYGDTVIVTGFHYQGRGKASYFGAIYEFLTDDTSSEGLVGIKEISDEYFEDDGHAVAWAIKNE